MRPEPVAHWADALVSWGIPAEILERAPQSPWIHPVQTFRPEGNLYVDTPSRLRALETLDRLPPGTERSVLDVGCGGGRAAFGLTPPATRVIGVDHQQAMLDVFAAEADRRGIACSTVLGDWPAVEQQTPTCPVVTCHHVVYNVAPLAPFVEALHRHATARVVVELPQQHPLAVLSPMWLHFWGLERPASPTAEDALNVVRSLGHDAHLEQFEVPAAHRLVTDEDVEFTRIRLCLPAARDAEIREYLLANPAGSRSLATIWWDVP